MPCCPACRLWVDAPPFERAACAGVRGHARPYSFLRPATGVWSGSGHVGRGPHAYRCSGVFHDGPGELLVWVCRSDIAAVGLGGLRVSVPSCGESRWWSGGWSVRRRPGLLRFFSGLCGCHGCGGGAAAVGNHARPWGSSCSGACCLTSGSRNCRVATCTHRPWPGSALWRHGSNGCLCWPRSALRPTEGE